MATTKQMQDRAKAARKAAKPTKQPKLLCAGYFYKSDKNGMEVMFSELSHMLPNLFSIEMHNNIVNNKKSYDEAWHIVNATGMVDGKPCTPEQLVKDYFHRLDTLITKNHLGTGVTQSEISEFVLTVEWLTKNGFLKQDEYNGTSYAYA